MKLYDQGGYCRLCTILSCPQRRRWARRKEMSSSFSRALSQRPPLFKKLDELGKGHEHCLSLDTYGYIISEVGNNRWHRVDMNTLSHM
jgi:hypothetical protein